MAATLTDLQNDVFGRSLTSDATAATRAINAVYKELVGLLGLNVLSVTVTLTGGTQSYNLGTLIHAAKAVDGFSALIALQYQALGGSPGAMEPIDLATMARQRSLFTTLGTPYYYTLVSNKQLELSPVPTTTGDTLVGWYAAFTPATVAAGGNTLAAGSDQPTLIPDEWHDVLALGASYRIASVKESAGDNKDLAIRLK